MHILYSDNCYCASFIKPLRITAAKCFALKKYTSKYTEIISIHIVAKDHFSQCTNIGNRV